MDSTTRDRFRFLHVSTDEVYGSLGPTGAFTETTPDASKIKHELNWEPRESLESGFEQTVDWYLNNGRWVERLTSGVYRRARLGLGKERA